MSTISPLELASMGPAVPAAPVPDYATPRSFVRAMFPPKLMDDLIEPETAARRRAWVAIALVVAMLYAVWTFTFFAPGDAGVDQNAYLAAGRMIAQTYTDKYELPNPYAYVGGMYVRISPVEQLGGTYYPKYPFGLPLLYAGFFWADRPVNFVLNHLISWHATHWVLAELHLLPTVIDGHPFKPWVAMFVVSPLSSVLAVFGMFFLARQVAGSFAGVMASILLGTSQVMQVLANNPNSHASCVACIVWGFYLLIRWWQTGSVWRGLLAGLLIGFAGTIRYSEVLLALPVGIACLTRVYWSNWRSYAQLLATAMVSAAVLLLIRVLTGPDLHSPLFEFGGSWHNGIFTPALSINGVWALVTVGILFTLALVSVPATAPRWHNQNQLILQISLLAVTWATLAIGIFLDYRQHWVYASGLETLAIAAFIVATWADWKDFYGRILPGLFWLIPVFALLLFNQRTMHTWTGYDATNESEFGAAFTWKKFMLTWEQVIRTFSDFGLFFVMPFGLAGLVMLFHKSWKLALVMLAWLLPGVALYTSYYWSPDRDVAYARFFLTFFPAVLVGVAVCFGDAMLAISRYRTSLKPVVLKNTPPTFWSYFLGTYPRASTAVTLAIGAVVAMAAGVSTHRDLLGMRDGNEGEVKAPLNEMRERVSLAQTGRMLMEKVPANSVLFTDGSGGISNAANYIQAIGDWEIFPADAFSIDGSRRGFGGGGGGGNRNRGGGGGNNGGGNNGGGNNRFGRGGGGGAPGGGGRFGGGNAAGGNNQQDPANPVAAPVQREQQEYKASLYSNKTTRELIKLQAGVLADAFAHGRHVFLAVSKDRLETFEEDLKDVGHYTFVPISGWQDISLPEDPPSDDKDSRNNNPWGGRNGFGGRGGGGFNMFAMTGNVEEWRLVEVKPAEPGSASGSAKTSVKSPSQSSGSSRRLGR